MTIAEYSRQRKSLIAKAKGELLSAMERTTESHGDMTALEWMHALQGVSDRLRVEALRDEWQDGPPNVHVIG